MLMLRLATDVISTSKQQIPLAGSFPVEFGQLSLENERLETYFHNKKMKIPQ